MKLYVCTFKRSITNYGFERVYSWIYIEYKIRYRGLYVFKCYILTNLMDLLKFLK